MLINIDIKGLEVVVAAYLSQDKILMTELLAGIDIHTENQKAFGLPSRLIAKVFKFRLLYGGTEFSFAKDPDFVSVSTNKKFWSKVIENYYNKYKGIKQWHNRLVQIATTEGTIISPTGRQFHYQQYQNKRGDWEWPITTIKNYIVQGTGADLVMIARISLANRLKKMGLSSKLVATVHDSLILDCPEEEWELVAKTALQAVQDVPMNFERLFGQEFNLPLTAEVLYGKTLGDMNEWSERE